MKMSEEVVCRCTGGHMDRQMAESDLEFRNKNSRQIFPQKVLRPDAGQAGWADEHCRQQVCFY